MLETSHEFERAHFLAEPPEPSRHTRVMVALEDNKYQ